MRVILLVLLFSLYSYSVSVPDVCQPKPPAGWSCVVNSSASYTYGDMIVDYKNECKMRTYGGSYIYDHEINTEDSHPCSWDSGKMCRNGSVTQYNCSCQNPGTINYPLPENKVVYAPILAYTCETDTDTVDRMVEQCEAVGGIFFLQEMTDCCGTSVCIVDDINSSDSQECPINSSYNLFTGKCECNNGYYESSDGCVPDPCTNPNQHYDVDANRCLCDEGYSSATYDLTGDGSGLNCQENNNNDSNDTSNDPCEYPSTKDGFAYHGKFLDQQVCLDDIKNFGCGNGTGLRNLNCSFGACYYNTTDNCPNNDGNDNNTSNSDDKESDIPTDENNSKITDADNNISLDITPITKALNTLDTSIKVGSSNIVDAIHQNTKSLGDKISALDSTVQSGLNRLHNDLTAPSHAPSIGGIQIDNSKVSDITSKVSDIKDKLSESSSLLENAISEYTSFVSNVTDSFNTLKENLTSYQEMFSNKPTVNISNGGSCNLQVNVFGKTVDFGSGLDSALLQIAPLFKFFMTVFTQVFLILMSIKFFTKD